ncbi:MAG TPA: FG-GAP-like repeat-containing protein [Bryobacteraceae bacterium]|nr:FG-GAP-like repeat-containing protein [Bryobacteraceae bacterium]
MLSLAAGGGGQNVSSRSSGAGEAAARNMEEVLATVARALVAGETVKAPNDQWTAGYRSARTASFRVIRIDLDGSRAQATIAGEIAGFNKNHGPTQERCTWESDWVRQTTGWTVRTVTTRQCTHQESDLPYFHDVTRSALGSNSGFAQQFGRGNAEWAERLDGISGIDLYGLNGIAVGDYDGDQWDDFFVCQPGGLPGRLFRNKGDGTFEDVTKAAGLWMLDATAAVLFGDYDNDGDRDLFVVTAGGVLLFDNDGRGHFTRSTRALFEIPPDEQGSMMMPALADFDLDGFVDLYVCVYSRSANSMAKYLHQPTPYFDANNGPPNHLFRNNGNGTFSDVTRKTGLSVNNSRWSFAASWSDYNRDGYPDLYVANDFGRSNLYRNNGNGTFTDVAAQAGVENIGPGMSAAWGDFDNDGLQDLYVSNIWSAAGQRIMRRPEFQPSAPAIVRDWMRRFSRGNSLFRNRGDGTFEEPAAAKDSANGGWAWGSDFIDADNDGWEDILVLNGHITNDRPDDLEAFHWTDVVGASPLEAVRSGPYAEGWRRFQNLMNESGFSIHGREMKKFYRNTGSGRFADFSAPSGLDFADDGRSFAALDMDRDGDLDLVLKNRTAPQIRVMRNGSAPGNKSVGFDLVGRRSNRDAIGARITFHVADKVRSKEVRAGSGFLSQHSHVVYFGLGTVEKLPVVRIDWPSGLSQEVRGLSAGAVFRIEEGRAGFISRPDRPKRKAAPESVAPATETGEYRGVWLLEPVRIPALAIANVKRDSAVAVTVSAGTGGQPVAQVSMAGETSSAVYPVPAAEIRLLNTLIKNLFARRRDVSLPFTLLQDGTGNIAKIYRGDVNPRWILDDFRRLPQNERQRAQLALPFPGPYHGPVGNRLEPYFLIGFECLQSGSYDEAMSYFEKCLRIDPGIPALHSNIGAIHARRGQIEESLASYRKAAQLDPGSADIQFNVGTTLALAGRFLEAVAALERATKMDPAAAESWANLGNVYLDLDKPDLARAPLERALALKPSAVIHNSLGTLHFQQAALDLARKHFEESIRLEPAYDPAYVNLGHVYLRLGDRPRAAQMFREALRTNPANAEAKRLLERP